MSGTTSVDEYIEETVENILGVSPEEYEDSTSFGPDGLDADSLQIVELVEVIEHDYDVQIPDEELENVETIGDTKDVVRSYGS